MNFWGPNYNHIFSSQHSVLSSQSGPVMIISLYIEGRKKSGLCLIHVVLISPIQVWCIFFMLSLILECLCKPIISYFTPIFLRLIMPPTLKKSGEHIAFGLSVCPSVQKKFKARVLKFHIWIPRQKIAYPYFFIV